ncbi:CaiB/BaiF CoA transferase family protein [Mycobacterium sp.]|jgi:crotonobetainyl-CoA:carnitine CoA-transferase CaiB-like acyl-CoA transferase|uniref:CaiB/BaiF CoA transferase family protein n=1 Tax=Mycobacterium sp. TaxID=1785 RepID=UPI003BAF3C4E
MDAFTSSGTDGAGGPLQDVRVIDFSSTVMGPYATQLMAQLGADVVKIEQPEGDIVRGIGDRDGRRLGPLFLNLNRGKRSVVLDLRNDDDYQTFLSYVAVCDVLVHNKPPATARRLAIDYDSVAHVNDRLIYCMVQGFGHDGPYRDKPAYDDIIQAASGMAHLQGGADGPQYVRTPLADKVTGLFALSAINAALYARQCGAGGQAIVVPMFETMVSFVLAEAQGDWVFWPPRGEPGYARMNSPQRKPFATADGTISVMPNTDTHWKTFFTMVGAAHMSDDPRYRDITARTSNIDSLYEFLAAELARRTTAEWMTSFDAVGIPAMPVLSIPELFNDPHLQATELFQISEHPVAGTLRQTRFPITFSNSVCGPVRPAPALGGG